MDRLAPGAQLAQTSPSVTSAVTLYAPPIGTEVTRIQCVNYSGSPVDVEVYHDDDGTTFDNTTIIEKFSAPANQTTELLYRNAGQGVSVMKGGAIGVKAGTADSVNFTAYGVPQVAR